MREHVRVTVARSIGSPPAEAATHCATSIDLDADFRRAVGLSPEAQQKAQQSAAVGAGQGPIPGQTGCEQTTKNREEATPGRLCATAAKIGAWAQQDSNTPTVSLEKPQSAPAGTVKRPAFGGDSFAEAVAAIMRLPLTDAERAEAVRRLLREAKAQA
jgi:hypothetical protein